MILNVPSLFFMSRIASRRFFSWAHASCELHPFKNYQQLQYSTSRGGAFASMLPTKPTSKPDYMDIINGWLWMILYDIVWEAMRVFHEMPTPRLQSKNRKSEHEPTMSLGRKRMKKEHPTPRGCEIYFCMFVLPYLPCVPLCLWCVNESKLDWKLGRGGKVEETARCESKQEQPKVIMKRPLSLESKQRRAKSRKKEIEG